MTAATTFIPYGCPPEMAQALATQIDTADASRSVNALLAVGISVPLANELITQFNAQTMVASNLMALGMPPALADVVAAQSPV